MKAHLFVILAAGLLVAAEQKEDVKKDTEKLQGTWIAREGDKEAHLTFAGEKFTIKDKDKEFAKGTFKVDPTKKPKAIDMMVTEDAEGRFKGKTSLGIYELDGDTFKWCANEPGKDVRPKEFAKEGGHMLLTFKREKK